MLGNQLDDEPFHPLETGCLGFQEQLISQTIRGTVSHSNDATPCHQELRSFAATPMDGTSAIAGGSWNPPGMLEK